MATLSQRVAQMVKDGELSAEDGKTMLYKADILSRILGIFNHVKKSPHSRVTGKTLAQANVEIIPWNTKTSDSRKPIFFEQMTLDDFQAYELPKFSSIYPPLDSREFAYAAQFRLKRRLSYLQPPLEDETLPEIRGWQYHK